MIRKIILSALIIIVLSGCQDNRKNNLSESQEKSKLNFEVTPAPDMGLVMGKFIDINTKEAYPASLYLSKNLTADHPGYPPVISFSYQTNPRAAQDDYGNFLFSDIEPGQYVIVVYKPSGQDFIKDSETNQPQLIDVKANQILELGTLEFN